MTGLGALYGRSERSHVLRATRRTERGSVGYPRQDECRMALTRRLVSNRTRQRSSCLSSSPTSTKSFKTKSTKSVRSSSLFEAGPSPLSSPPVLEQLPLAFRRLSCSLG